MSNGGIFFRCSLNDSFAHVKRELAGNQHTNVMMEFMWSSFRKVVGINNRKASKDDEQKAPAEEELQVPLARFDGEEL
jgi:hypothetical protein